MLAVDDFTPELIRMPSSSNFKSGMPDEKVHLEKCKICGEWVNRLSLDDIVQHLDHSRRPNPQDDPAQSSSMDERKRRTA
jgi:hypothetical protein